MLATSPNQLTDYHLLQAKGRIPTEVSTVFVPVEIQFRDKSHSLKEIARNICKMFPEVYVIIQPGTLVMLSHLNRCQFLVEISDEIGMKLNKQILS